MSVQTVTKPATELVVGEHFEYTGRWFRVKNAPESASNGVRVLVEDTSAERRFLAVYQTEVDVASSPPPAFSPAALRRKAAKARAKAKALTDQALALERLAQEEAPLS